MASGPGPHTMLPASPDAVVAFEPAFRPKVLVIVDVEEEFDWTAPFSRENTRVKTIAAQQPAERIFREFGIVPTYVVDYPVAAQPSGYEPLRDLLSSGGCEIGAQLHPWVTPPHEERFRREIRTRTIFRRAWNAKNSGAHRNDRAQFRAAAHLSTGRADTVRTR